jgi:beta-glucosidase-like glycosyl hydrolase
VDINNNPKNPVIGFRSFGDDKLQVARKAGAYMKGMQDKGILVSLKHFPGHGDTDVDSHYDLPQLNFDRGRLDSLEMFPFKELIKNGASGVMVAHMNIPALDASPSLPSTLSKPIVSGILKNDLGFKGLVFSDAMNMKGVIKFFPNGDADVRALMAGNDVLELSENSKRGIKLVRKAIRKKQLSWEQINVSVKKVLAAKYWAGLHQNVQLNPANLHEDLHRPSARALNQELADATVTVLNSRKLIDDLDPNKKTVILSLGSAQTTVFQQELRSYFKQAEFICLDKSASAQQVEEALTQISPDMQIIVSIHDSRKRPAAVLDYNADLLRLMNRSVQNGALISLFANPYTLIQLPEIAKAQTLVLNYQNSEEMQKAAVKVITKAIPSKGKLPVNINASLKNGDGL